MGKLEDIPRGPAGAHRTHIGRRRDARRSLERFAPRSRPASRYTFRQNSLVIMADLVLFRCFPPYLAVDAVTS